MKLKIAYQGEPGANSHIACLEAYPDCEPVSCHTFEDAFQALKEGGANLAMIPIENSVAGRVADIHHLLPESDLHIIGEHFLRIHHQLMALPGVSIDIATIVARLFQLPCGTRGIHGNHSFQAEFAGYLAALTQGLDMAVNGL